MSVTRAEIDAINERIGFMLSTREVEQLVNRVEVKRWTIDEAFKEMKDKMTRRNYDPDFAQQMWEALGGGDPEPKKEKSYLDWYKEYEKQNRHQWAKVGGSAVESGKTSDKEKESGASSAPSGKMGITSSEFSNRKQLSLPDQIPHISDIINQAESQGLETTLRQLGKYEKHVKPVFEGLDDKGKTFFRNLRFSLSWRTFAKGVAAGVTVLVLLYVVSMGVSYLNGLFPVQPIIEEAVDVVKTTGGATLNTTKDVYEAVKDSSQGFTTIWANRTMFEEILRGKGYNEKTIDMVTTSTDYVLRQVGNIGTGAARGLDGATSTVRGGGNALAVTGKIIEDITESVYNTVVSQNPTVDNANTLIASSTALTGGSLSAWWAIAKGTALLSGGSFASVAVMSSPVLVMTAVTPVVVGAGVYVFTQAAGRFAISGTRKALAGFNKNPSPKTALAITDASEQYLKDYTYDQLAICNSKVFDIFSGGGQGSRVVRYQNFNFMVPSDQEISQQARGNVLCRLYATMYNAVATTFLNENYALEMTPQIPIEAFSTDAFRETMTQIGGFDFDVRGFTPRPMIEGGQALAVITDEPPASDKAMTFFSDRVFELKRLQAQYEEAKQTGSPAKRYELFSRVSKLKSDIREDFNKAFRDITGDLWLEKGWGNNKVVQYTGSEEKANTLRHIAAEMQAAGSSTEGWWFLQSQFRYIDVAVIANQLEYVKPNFVGDVNLKSDLD